MNTLRKFIEKDIQMSGIYFLISSNYFDFINGHWPKCPWQFIKYPKLIVKPVIGTKLSAIMIVTNLRTKKMGFNFCISVENSTFRNPSFLHMKNSSRVDFLCYKTTKLFGSQLCLVFSNVDLTLYTLFSS